MKKGDISINVIVMAVIALLVMVVLIAIFGGRMKGFLTGARDCRTQGGECIEREECTPIENTIVPITSCDDMNKDSDLDYVCCAPLIGETNG
ncbi:MAG: hypothetical protein NDI94_03955 [Candidatus Woesearchaeota archaeon]|jgi:hypothetical protein|nr:hypothetical protein [Candidatus Woesearchaeota archaeon]